MFSLIKKNSNQNPSLDLATSAVSDNLVYDLRATAEEFKYRRTLGNATLNTSSNEFKTHPFEGDATVLRAECKELSRTASLGKLEALRSGFRAAGGSSNSGGLSEANPAPPDEGVFILLLGSKYRAPAPGTKLKITDTLLQEYRQFEVLRLSFGSASSILFEHVQMSGSLPSALPAPLVRIADDSLGESEFLTVNAEAGKELIAAFTAAYMQGKENTRNAITAPTTATAPAPAGDVAAILKGLSTVISEVVSAVRPPPPSTGAEAQVAVSSETLKGKQELLRLCRIFSPLAAALRTSASTVDKKTWGSLTRGLFLNENVTIPMAASEAIGCLEFSNSPGHIASLTSIYRYRYPGAAEAPVDIEKQLSTLSWVVATLNNSDAEHPFVAHMKDTVGHLVTRVRLASSAAELAVYSTRLIPALLDQIGAFIANALYSCAQLRADYPAGWYAPGSALAASLDRECAAAQAQQLAVLTQQVQAMRPGANPRIAHPKGGAADPKKDTKKRPRDSRPLLEVCKHVLISGKEEDCGNDYCKRQHAFPPGTSAADKASAKARVLEKPPQKRGG